MNDKFNQTGLENTTIGDHANVVINQTSVRVKQQGVKPIQDKALVF